MVDEYDYEKRLRVFFSKGIAVHIVLKNNKWFNGYIREIGSDFIILNEFKFGETLIFFSEITNLETFTKKDGAK